MHLKSQGSYIIYRALYAKHFLLLLDVKDFIPVLKNEGYEEFGALVDRANSWLKNQAGVRVINLQSVLVQKDQG